MYCDGSPVRPSPPLENAKPKTHNCKKRTYGGGGKVRKSADVGIPTPAFSTQERTTLTLMRSCSWKKDRICSWSSYVFIRCWPPGRFTELSISTALRCAPTWRVQRVGGPAASGANLAGSRLPYDRRCFISKITKKHFDARGAGPHAQRTPYVKTVSIIDRVSVFFFVRF